ncbi:MAG: phytoene desaturase [Flavobacteriales bacterium]|jgi:phytoene desaturase
MTNIIVIGAGFAGLSAACSLAQKGFKVQVLDRHSKPGGRARQIHAQGFTFDMGPSWYWMPDVFDAFFEGFGKKTSDYYDLERLDPSYKVIFEDEAMNIPAKENELIALFEKVEKGSGKKLQKFLKDAQFKYEVGMQDFIYKPGASILEFLDRRVISASLKLHLFSNISKLIREEFKNKKLQELLEFPVLFLGAKPQNTPALYSLMNYADMKLGTWYPKGGMVKVVDAMYDLALELGVVFKFDCEVKEAIIEKGIFTGVECTQEVIKAEALVAAGDYNYFEQKMLPKKYRRYDEVYWEKRKMAPSSIIFYLGIDIKIPKLEHHNLFFDADFEKHSNAIYETPSWVEDPLFYLSCTSITDDTAPKGCENLFLLIPTAPGLKDTEEVRANYLKRMIKRIQKQTGVDITGHIIYKQSFSYQDFVEQYHSFKGNAYGLANTLDQTAIFKPKMKSKKVENIFYAGQLTVPGPGVPPSIISGQIVANLIAKKFSKSSSI